MLLTEITTPSKHALIYDLFVFPFFLIFEFNFIYFFIQQVLISHQLYTHQCIHVNSNRPIFVFLDCLNIVAIRFYLTLSLL